MDAPFPTLAARVREQCGLTWSRAKKLCAEGRVRVDGERCTDPAARVSPEAEVVVDENAPRLRTGALAEASIVFVDRDVVVVDKPAGILSAPDESGTGETLATLARTVLRRMKAGPDAALALVHRLDRDTSGLLVLARNAAAQRHLAAQFRGHDVERAYEAIVHGALEGGRIETMLVPDRGDGLRGSFGLYRRARGPAPPEARRAVTHVEALKALRGATLAGCRLETGRQHQVRIHLSERGHPLVGERVYIRDYAGPRIDAARPMLHAKRLGFVHPRTGKPVSFTREAPADFTQLLERLA